VERGPGAEGVKVTVTVQTWSWTSVWPPAQSDDIAKSPASPPSSVYWPIASGMLARLVMVIVSGVDAVPTGCGPNSRYAGDCTRIGPDNAGSTMPVSAMSVLGAAAFDCTVIVALTARLRGLTGIIWASMRQLCVGARVSAALHVVLPAMRKSPGLAPASSMAEMESGASPVLVMNTGCRGLG
jgi:hypothetical protein